MDALTVYSDSPKNTRAFGEAIGRRLTGGEIVLLGGPLGAGKTTLAQGIALGLGVRGPVQSPSFVLERIHRGRLTLRHLDFYRLTPRDVDEAGFLDETDGSSVVVIEWAERGGDIPDACILITLSFVPGEPDRRKIAVVPGSLAWGDMMKDAKREAGL